MDSSLISVIILSYNNLQFHKSCLESVLTQCYRNVELIFGDDGSNNFDAAEILRFINLNKNSNLKNVSIYHNAHNLGVVKNYNKAIKMSQGDYIFYLGVDDLLYDHHILSDVVQYFESTGELIATGYRDVYDSTMQKYLKTLPRDLEVDFIKRQDASFLFEKLCGSSFIAGSCTPFSRKLIEQYGYLDEGYVLLEDYPRYLNLARRGCNIGFIDRKLIKYRMGGITTSGMMSPVLAKDLRRAYESEAGQYYKDNWKIDMLTGKKIIVWGTGDCYQNCRGLYDFNIEYFVDSNKQVQGTLLEGKEIHSPEKLLIQSKDDIFILVFSYANYYDISEWLIAHGFEEKLNYYYCNPEALRSIRG